MNDSENMKKVGLNFLHSFNEDKEEIKRDLRINLSSIKSAMKNERYKTKYSLDELLDIFEDITSEVNAEFDKALSTLSIKGVKRLRSVIDYGVEGSLELDEGLQEQEFSELDETKETDTKIPETRPKEEVQSPERETSDVDIYIRKKTTRTKAPPVPDHKTDRAEAKERAISGETDNISDELKGAFNHMDSVITTTQDPETINTELFNLLERLETHRNKLAISIAKLENKNPKQAQELEQELKNIEAKIEQLADTLARADLSVKTNDDLLIVREDTETLLSSIERVNEPIKKLEEMDEAEEEELGEQLTDIYETLKRSLMEPGAAIDKLTSTLERVKSKELSKRTESDLKKSLNMFKQELRKRNMILEHTRKMLASNPKFNALFILQELGGGMTLSTLAKAVGVAPVVLKAQLQDFVNRNLIQIDTTHEDPVVKIVFG